MKNETWSDEELNVARSSRSNADVAMLVGRSEAAVRGKRQRLGVQTVCKRLAATEDAKPAPATYEQDRERTDGEFWKIQLRDLHFKYERALREQSAVEQLVNAAKELAPVSYQPAPFVLDRRPKGREKNSAQSAVLLLSDTHVGQVIEPSQTLGYGEYNFDVFLARLKFLENAVTSIVTDHTTTAIDELVVCLGGDMLHGALNHGAEVGQHSTLFQQFYGAGHALAQFLRNVSTLAPAVRVFCTVGNHPRWGHQHKMPTDNRYSNLDQFLYAYTEALTRDIPSIQWSLDRQPFALFDVQGFRFHLSHGDHLKGGDKALGIPNHAVGRMVSSTSQLFGKECAPSPNYYLVGHLHRGIVLPHARGSFLVNGGFPGVDGYGLAGGFSPVDPTQLFFLVHPKFGKTATYDIQLKHAGVSRVGGAVVPPYSLPTGFLPA